MTQQVVVAGGVRRLGSLRSATAAVMGGGRAGLAPAAAPSASSAKCAPPLQCSSSCSCVMQLLLLAPPVSAVVAARRRHRPEQDSPHKPVGAASARHLLLANSSSWCYISSLLLVGIPKHARGRLLTASSSSGLFVPPAGRPLSSSAPLTSDMSTCITTTSFARATSGRSVCHAPSSYLLTARRSSASP